MPIHVQCQNCGKKLRAPDRFAGKFAKCSGCQGKVLVPNTLNADVQPTSDRPPDGFDPMDVLNEAASAVQIPDFYIVDLPEETDSETQPPPPEVCTYAGEEDSEPMTFPDEDTVGEDTTSRKGLHKQRIAVALSAVAGMSGCFLPWLNAPIVGAVTGMASWDGRVVLGLFSATAMVALYGHSSAMTRGSQLTCAVPALVAAAIAGHKIYAIYTDIIPHFSENEWIGQLSENISPGVGLFTIVLGGFAVFVAPYYISD